MFYPTLTEAVQWTRDNSIATTSDLNQLQRVTRVILYSVVVQPGLTVTYMCMGCVLIQSVRCQLYISNS